MRHANSEWRQFYSGYFGSIPNLAVSPIVCSNLCPKISRRASLPGGPTICTPVGRPAEFTPLGTDNAGQPNKLNGRVKQANKERKGRCSPSISIVVCPWGGARAGPVGTTKTSNELASSPTFFAVQAAAVGPQYRSMLLFHVPG